jgi:Mn2+/Fe2+ NRAMP family transporter
MMDHTNGLLMNAIGWMTSLTMIGLSILLLIRGL